MRKNLVLLGFLIIFSLLLTSLNTYVSISQNTGINSELLKKILSEYYEKYGELLSSDPFLEKIFSEAFNLCDTDPEQAINMLSKALTLDNDKDGLPDLVELIDKLSSYNMFSSGQHDMLHMVNTFGILIDGYIGEWTYIKHTVISLQSKASSSLNTPLIREVMLTRNKTHVFLGIVFSTIIYPDPTNYTIEAIRFDGSILKADYVKVYMNSIEAIIPNPLKDFKLVIKINYEAFNIEEGVKINVKIGSIPYLSINYDILAKFIAPLKQWYQPIPQNLPWYPLVVFGDNRPKDMSAVKFDEPFYRLVRELWLINPEAIIGTGDHVGLGRTDQIREFLKLMAGLPNTWIATGNHDWSYVKAGANRQFWEEYVTPNLNIVDSIPGWRIILINGYALEAKDIDTSKITDIVRREDVIKAIENSGDRKIILVFHVPPLDKGYGYPTVFSRDQMEFLRNIIKDYSDKIRLVLCGHWHVWNRVKYFNVDLVITGGGGAPLSSSGGIPEYHYAILILMPNGTYKLWPIKTLTGEVKEYYENIGNNKIIVKIINTKQNINNEPTIIPKRISVSFNGITVYVYLLVPPGEHEIIFEKQDGKIIVETGKGINQWFVYFNGEIMTPANTKNYIAITIPKSPVSPFNITYEIADDMLKLYLNINSYPTISYVLSNGEYTYSSALKLVREHTYYGLTYIPSDGIYNITIYMIYLDTVWVKHLSLKLDNYPPAIEILKLPASISKTITFEIKVSDLTLSRITVYLDDKIVIDKFIENNESVIIPVTIDPHELGEGYHMLKVEAVDKFNHESSVTRRFIVDFEAPKIFVNLPGKVVEGGNDYLTITIDDASFDRGEIYVNGTFKYLFKDKYVEIPLAMLDIVLQGTYNITIIAYDKAGNINSTSLIVHVLPMHQTTTTTSSTTTTIESTTITTTYTTSGVQSNRTSTTESTETSGGGDMYQLLIPICIAIILAIIVSLTLYRRHK